MMGVSRSTADMFVVQAVKTSEQRHQGAVVVDAANKTAVGCVGQTRDEHERGRLTMTLLATTRGRRRMW